MKLTCLLITALICACMLFCSCGSDPSRVTPEDSLITNREVSYSDDESNYTYNSGVFAPTSYAAFKITPRIFHLIY